MSITREVSLWLNNEPGPYHVVMSMAKDQLQHAVDNESHARTARNDAIEALALDIEEYVCQSMPCVKGLWGSLISAALQAVDFEEVAKGFLDDEPIYSVFSSDAEDAELFTSIEDAREHLASKLDDDNTMHAGPFLKLAKLEAGERIDIDGVEYTLGVS